MRCINNILHPKLDLRSCCQKILTCVRMQLFLWILFLAGMTPFFVSGVYASDLPAECRYLETHVARDDVAYKPGVDVRGNAVVSADLNAAPFVVPDIIRVPLTVDIIERLPDAPAGLEGQGDLGMIEIHKNGRITLNGQDWSQPFQALCGHKEEDAVISEPQKEKSEKEIMDDERVIFGGDYK